MTRAEASRINGAQSKGPKTPEGKSNSSQNNYRHGLYAKRTVVLRSESHDVYEENKAAYINTFKPRNTMEAEAVINIVNAIWKLRRIEKDTTNILDLRRIEDREKHQATLRNYNLPAAETLAYDSNCTGQHLHTLQMLLKAENSCQLAIGRNLRNIEKARKLIDAGNNPPVEEIVQATRFPVEPPPPPPTPEPEPEPKTEPESQKSNYEPKKVVKMPTLPLLVLVLAAVLWIYRATNYDTGRLQSAVMTVSYERMRRPLAPTNRSSVPTHRALSLETQISPRTA